MTRDFLIRIHDIIDSIDTISTHLKRLKGARLEEDVTVQDAIFRRLMIIGEAVKDIPGHIKAQQSDIDWKKIAGMRDILIHNYYNVSLDIVENTLKKNLPKLKKALNSILKEAGE